MEYITKRVSHSWIFISARRRETGSVYPRPAQATAACSFIPVVFVEKVVFVVRDTKTYFYEW